MINRLSLRNFKCFRQLDLELKPLSLLCGLNGMGKSSVIQSLLVLKQSYDSGDLLEGRLLLGGDQTDLGNGVDLLHEDADEDVIGFSISSTADDLHDWSLEFDYQRDADQLQARPLRVHRPPSFVPMGWRITAPFGGPFSYVSAERLGPRKSYMLSKMRARDRYVGVRGEYAVNALMAHASDIMVEGDHRLKDGSHLRLIDQVNAWLDEISPGSHVELEPVLEADAVIMGFSFLRESDIPSRRYRATNVGFGLSYVLPVLVALLTAKPGGMVIVENPEAHLHPRGQTRLAELAVRTATAGVQVIVETHSDHFMDGVRICVRDGLATPTDVSFGYFMRAGSETVLTVPTIDACGRLSSWPDGFFDQHELNLARLIAPK